MFKSAVGGALALLCTAGAASAHHSGAMFDRAKTVVLKGVVKEYQFTNPHSWIEIVVTENGKSTQWGIEGESPNPMRRLGLTPSTLKTGDMVTLRTHPLKDGRPGGSFIDIVLANGKLVSSNPNAQPQPAPSEAPATTAPSTSG